MYLDCPTIPCIYMLLVDILFGVEREFAMASLDAPRSSWGVNILSWKLFAAATHFEGIVDGFEV